jgi:hypothetical protein
MNSSCPRLSNMYFDLSSGVSSGNPASAQAFHPLRTMGCFRRYGP